MSRRIKNVVIAGLGDRKPWVSYPGRIGELWQLQYYRLDTQVRGHIPHWRHGQGGGFQLSRGNTIGLALQGQDAVVDAILSPNPTVSIGLINTAVTTGVCRYIAPEFSIHPKYDKTRSLPIFRGKAQIYDHLQKVANDQKITWTAIPNGAFLDWCLRTGFLSLDVINKKIVLMNDGTRVFPLTVLPAVGTAVANALARAQKTRNMHCSIYSVQKSQKEIADLAKEVLGADGWEIKNQDMEKVLEEALSAVAIGDYSWPVVGDLIRSSLATPGYSGLFEQNDNDLLGVRPMSDEQVKVLIKEISDELKSGPQ